ncbi:uncharacterized protein [Watersipora subatra]|uniref:uncharacterized protein n=1 Tax=Watersipora subatra TaxID=2589382 RepID=UPI00355C3F01
MATVVEGEASESDDEFEESFGEPVTDGGSTPKDSPSESMSSKDSLSLVKSLSENDSSTDVSPYDGHQKKVVIKHKYKSLFQKKLVEEMFSLRSQVETIVDNSYAESTRNMRQLVKNADALTSNLKKSTYQLQLLTNDLFKLEDQIDLVNQQKPFISLKLPSHLRTDAPVSS